jgi:hypothetical protein
MSRSKNKGRMEKEDYCVGFTVHEARDLVSQDGNVIDPLVIVRCSGNEWMSEVKFGKLAHVAWESGMIWSDIQLYPEQYDAAVVEFEVQAANAVFENDIIGRGTVQCALVRKRRNHSYSGKFINIMNET